MNKEMIIMSVVYIIVLIILTIITYHVASDNMYKLMIKEIHKEKETQKQIVDFYRNLISKKNNKIQDLELELQIYKYTENDIKVTQELTTKKKIQLNSIYGKFSKELSVDNVNHPQHYTTGKVECIDAIESATMELTGIEAVCTANTIKYMWRWKQKNGAEDLKKARWYLNHLITINESEE